MVDLILTVTFTVNRPAHLLAREMGVSSRLPQQLLDFSRHRSQSSDD